MNKIKNALYTVTAATLALAPAIASAQLGKGMANAQAGGTPSGSITDIIGNIMKWLLAILGFLGIIGFVIAGILYLTAAGDEDQIGKAKNAMMYSIIGVIVALLGFVVLQAVQAMLGGSSTTY